MCVLTEKECTLLEKLSERARLYISPSEKTILCNRLKEIENFFKILDKAELLDEKPLYHVLEVSGKLRDDTVVEFESTRITQSLSDRINLEGYFVAPWKRGYK